MRQRGAEQHRVGVAVVQSVVGEHVLVLEVDPERGSQRVVRLVHVLRRCPALRSEIARYPQHEHRDQTRDTPNDANQRPERVLLHRRPIAMHPCSQYFHPRGRGSPARLLVMSDPEPGPDRGRGYPDANLHRSPCEAPVLSAKTSEGASTRGWTCRTLPDATGWWTMNPTADHTRMKRSCLPGHGDTRQGRSTIGLWSHMAPAGHPRRLVPCNPAVSGTAHESKGRLSTGSRKATTSRFAGLTLSMAMC